MLEKLPIKTITSLTSLTVATLLCASQVMAKEYIVKVKYDLKDYHSADFNRAAISPFNVTGIQPDLNLIKVDVSNQSAAMDPIRQLMDHFDADYVVENVMLHAFLSPSDPRRGEQWALDIIDASRAWDISVGSHNVVVAVIDTGIDSSHEELRNNLWVNPNEISGNGVDDDNNGYVDDLHGWDFKGNDREPIDETSAQNPGHGTHCAGIIGASCGNNVGVCGVSPTVSLMALRFLGSDGSGDLFAAVKAIEYAAKNGAHIISASWGAAIPQSGAQPIIDAIKSAEEKGIIFVAAAGNEGKSNDTTSTYPANAQTPNMFSVAASNRDDQKPSWSNYGRKVDIAAPGENILSTIPGDYKELSGTSMATPLVAGTVALMKSLDLSLSGAVARSILQSTGTQVNIETASKRRINAHEALKAVADKKLTVVPATLTLSPNGDFNFSAWGGVPPYRFQSLNPAVATIDELGHLVAISEGDVTIEVSDAQNNKATSVSIKVGGAPPAESSCPLPNELLCLLLCSVNPELPWCKDLPALPGLPGLPGLPPGLPGLPPGLPGLPGLPDLPFPPSP